MDNAPAPGLPPIPFTPAVSARELQMRNWLRLRRELSELHARLEYLKLMLVLGVSR